MRLIEEVAKSPLPKSRLMVGTGGCALADAIQLSNIAIDAGLAGILVLPPFYYKPVTDDGLFGFLRNWSSHSRLRRQNSIFIAFPN